MKNQLTKYIIFLLLSSQCLFAQKNDIDIKAQYYFDKGEYEQAIPLYEELIIHSESNQIIYQKLLQSYIKISQFDKANDFVNSMILKFPYRASYLVDLGYLHKKKGDNTEKIKKYNEALSRIKEKPNQAYSVSNRFQIYLETKWALDAYKIAEIVNPKMNFAIQKANLYGELGDVDSMLINYFVIVEKQPSLKSSIKRYLQSFLKQNPSQEIGDKVKNILLVKIQETNKPAFSELLLWYFADNRKYNSALVQAKALYKRNYTGLSTIQFLGQDALKNKQFDNAEKCFLFICSQDTIGLHFFKAKQCILELQKNKLHNKLKDDQIIAEYKRAINKKTINEEHFNLIISYAKFIAFEKNKPALALDILEKETASYSKYNNIIARKFLLEGDIYLLLQEFTKSFLAYQKAETWTKDQFVSDEAKFKSVKVSFYKGDFKWALDQSKVLKKSVSKLYANNSAELLFFLQSSYNSDSSDVPIKLYAKADLLKLQGQTDSAYAYFKQIIKSFPSHYLIPLSLYSQSEILIEKLAYNSAIETLKTLYLKYPNNNLAPFALLRLSEVYLQKLNSKKEAREWLKELLLKFPDSPLAQEARELYKQIV